MDNFYPIRYFFKKVRIFTNLIFPIKIDLHGIITDFMVKSVHTYGKSTVFSGRCVFNDFRLKSGGVYVRFFSTCLHAYYNRGKT